MGGRRTNECKRRAVGGLMDVKGVGRRTDEFGGRAVGGLILALGGHRSPTRASPSHSGPQPAPMPPPPWSDDEDEDVGGDSLEEHEAAATEGATAAGAAAESPSPSASPPETEGDGAALASAVGEDARAPATGSDGAPGQVSGPEDEAVRLVQLQAEGALGSAPSSAQSSEAVKDPGEGPRRMPPPSASHLPNLLRIPAILWAGQ